MAIKLNNIVRNITWFIIKNSKTLFILSTIGAVISVFIIVTGLKVDNSLKIWFLENDKNYTSYMNFQETYGNDDVLSVMIESKENIVTPNFFKHLIEVEEKLK